MTIVIHWYLPLVIDDLIIVVDLDLTVNSYISFSSLLSFPILAVLCSKHVVEHLFIPHNPWVSIANMHIMRKFFPVSETPGGLVAFSTDMFMASVCVRISLFGSFYRFIRS